jgi:curved DNA-binding protein CbpA
VPGKLREALQLLRLGWQPTDETLVTAWRQRALETHPDRGGEHKTFVAVQGAYEVVQEALKRGLPREPSAGGYRHEEEHGSYGDVRYAAFRRGMRRSAKGNLWQPWGRLTVTVFAKRGSYHYCISENDEPHWSPWAGYPNQEAACQALWRAVQRWAD